MTTYEVTIFESDMEMGTWDTAEPKVGTVLDDGLTIIGIVEIDHEAHTATVKAEW